MLTNENMKTVKFDKKIVSLLENIVGKNNIISDIEGVYAYSFDCAHIPFSKENPIIVVQPENTVQVSEILKTANNYNIPVIPRGAGTNHAGGCAPVKGGIIIHFSKMNKILEINNSDLTCRVQPGVVVADLQKAAKEVGLFYPPDPSNLAVSTIGGGIALSSGGPRAFKYGTVKDYVLDLEVVLADGTIIRTGANTPKNVTGYNLTQLIVGSEGTLGIVTEAVMKLIPEPEKTNVLLAYYESIEEAVNSVSEIINNHLTPSVVDLIDKKTIQTIENFYPTGLLCNKEALLIIEVDGDEASISHQQEKIISLCRKNGSVEVICAKDEEERTKIWTSRRSAFGACAQLAPNVITEDVVVPRSKIADLSKGILEISERYNLITMVMGHIGDGNIHPNFALDLRDKKQRENFEKAKTELFKLAVSLGGTLSGEHGIGCQKARFLPIALDKTSLKLMKEIKKIFDPKNILNPEKMM
ncbi:MAG: FAD-binding protein [Clostridium sp.]|nr:FAD-binding protein [Clostridium sp.]